jgi:peptidoglycan/xylan/chitin deacetylase (PgdA/CDA1 family)
MSKNKTILLTFDVEEFDTPLRHKIRLSKKDQLYYGNLGLEAIMRLYDTIGHPPSTFYTTANFANHYPENVRSLAKEHEIASHTYYHSRFRNEDVLSSKLCLEDIIQDQIYGFRMPNMADFDKSLIKKSGYIYDSSINPTYIPGKYNYLNTPIHPYLFHDVIELPTSVVPYCRFPLFWLSFKALPLPIFIQLCNFTLLQTGFLNLYFHPWEFTDLSLFKIPNFIKNPSGNDLIEKLKKFIQYYQKKDGVEFLKTIDFVRGVEL